MLRQRTSGLVALLVAMAVPIAGCTGTDSPAPSPSTAGSAAPTPRATPVSDEEAIADAMAVLADYDEQWLRLWSDPSTDVSLIVPYVTEAMLEEDRSGLATSRGDGYHYEGPIRYMSTQLLEKDDQAAKSLLLCQDLTGLREIDRNGIDVTPPDRPSEVPVRVTFEVEDTRLLISSFKLWKGSNPCAS